DDPAQPAGPGLVAPLLAQEPVLGPPGSQQLADRVLGGQVRLADEVGRRALARHAALSAPSRAFEQQAAGQPGGLGGEVGELLAQSNPGGRRSAHGRSDSSCAASASSGPSRPGGATICTDSGNPSGESPAGTAIAGWPVRFQTPL